MQVLVVDDHAAFRSAARAVVTHCPGFSVAGEASTGEEAVSLAATLHPDLVLMDINLGGLDGIEATRRLLAEHPSTRVVLVSTYEEADLPAGAATCGAVGYLHKDELSPATLRAAWAGA